jgi:hypothetical protein
MEKIPDITYKYYLVREISDLAYPSLCEAPPVNDEEFTLDLFPKFRTPAHYFSWILMSFSFESLSIVYIL